MLLSKNSLLNLQSGRSTLEILGVLAVVAVLSIAGIAGYAKVMEKINIDETLQQLSEIVTNTRQLLESQLTYAGLDNDFAVKFSLIPAKMVKSHDTIEHNYGGEVKIKSVSDGNGFALVYNGLPSTVCVQIATAPLKFEENGLRYLIVKPFAYDLPRNFPKTLSNGEFAHEELPITYPQAVENCGCQTSTCGVAFFFQ